MSIIVIVVLLAIIGSLGHALSSMAVGPDRSHRMAQALTVRVTLSVALFALLLIGAHVGWIHPR